MRVGSLTSFKMVNNILTKIIIGFYLKFRSMQIAKVHGLCWIELVKISLFAKGLSDKIAFVKFGDFAVQKLRSPPTYPGS